MSKFDNKFNNGWLAEQENLCELFGDPGDMLQIVGTDDAMSKIAEEAKTPVLMHPWQMAETLHKNGELPYKRLTVFNQDANNCAGQGTARAIEAFMLISKWIATRKELTPFETFVPWIWGVGKNEAGRPGTDGATMGEMLAMVTQRGILPTDTPGLPPYAGTSNAWARNYGRNAQNAPYSKFWDEAKKYIVTVARLPKDADAFYLACKAGYAVAFGTSQKIIQQKASTDLLRIWKASGSWMHAMAAYGYNQALDSVGIDNSHGDGFAWADKTVLRSVVTNSRYFDAFVILDIQARPAGADWSLVGRN